MKKISILLTSAFLVLGVNVCFANETVTTDKNKIQNLQVFSVDNTKGTINAKSIEKAFNASGLVVDVNNDMNSIFSKRYKHVHHKNYNLAIFHNDKSIIKLIKKYPSIGLITPLSMSIYSDDAKHTINISTLSLAGMARITQIPLSNPDLIEYAKHIDTAVHAALPNGAYSTVNHSTKAKDNLTTVFTSKLEIEEGSNITEAKESFEEEFVGELGPVGFLVPKSYKLQDELFKANGVSDYDFFDTYSIIRFNVIYPVSKNHPDAGAYAPFSLAIYKKKGEDAIHIIYPSIDNWISDLDISDKETIKAVNQTQDMLKTILEELTE
jgi:uncharacterized protein (DUF302 family)